MNAETHIAQDDTVAMVDIDLESYLPHFELVVRDGFAEFFAELEDNEFRESFVEVLIWSYASGFNDCMAAMVDMTTAGVGVSITEDMGEIIQNRKHEREA